MKTMNDFTGVTEWAQKPESYFPAFWAKTGFFPAFLAKKYVFLALGH